MSARWGESRLHARNQEDLIMSKRNYSPNDHRSMAKNPNNPAYQATQVNRAHQLQQTASETDNDRLQAPGGDGQSKSGNGEGHSPAS